jgi:hypothetical protein
MPDSGLENLGFVASTGRTATTLISKILSQLDTVLAMHEGHYVDDDKKPLIPAINLDHRKAWFDEEFRSSLVATKRSIEELEKGLDNEADASVLIDVAYYNSAIVNELCAMHPHAKFVLIFRRCEDFVRSATTLEGEDLMPVGWPPADKPLTSREKFIALGRLRPQVDSADAVHWDDWSAIQKNIWLWKKTNSHLYRFLTTVSKGHAVAVSFETLTADPQQFWKTILVGLNIYTEANIAFCLGKSNCKINAKSGGYQIGASDTWLPEERQFLRSAQDLEQKIYESRNII